MKMSMCVTEVLQKHTVKPLDQAVLLMIAIDLSVQIVCVPYEWRIKLFIIILVNAAVSVVVEVRNTLEHRVTVDVFLMSSFCFFMQCSHLCLIQLDSRLSLVS